MATLFGIRHCDTVRRARAWLTAHGVEHAFHDFKCDGVPPDHLARWLAAVGPERLLNRQGTTWRKLDEGGRASANDPAALVRLLLVQPTLIRRPVVEWDDGMLTVGFDETDWARRLRSTGQASP